MEDGGVQDGPIDVDSWLPAEDDLMFIKPAGVIVLTRSESILTLDRRSSREPLKVVSHSGSQLKHG